MEEQLTQLGAEDFELPNNNLETAYEFFLNNYLHPIDIAVELFDFPEVINNPFDDYEFKNAFNNHLISKKQLEDYAVIFLLNQKFEKYAQSRSIQQTDFKTSLDHYWVEDNVIHNSTEEFKQDLRDFRSIDITKYLCAYLLNICLSKQAYIDQNFLASNFIYHVALDNLVHLKLLLGKNLMLDTNRIYKNISITNGGKGGRKKAEKSEAIKKKFLDYHDEHCSIINKAGKYHFSPPKAAEKILNDISSPDENGKCEYEVNSLAHIIREHRKALKKNK